MCVCVCVSVYVYVCVCLYMCVYVCALNDLKHAGASHAALFPIPPSHSH